MNDQIPDFEPPAPMFEDEKPAKKPRKKPTKRMKRRIPVAAVVPKKRVVKKRRLVRRGRPAGVPNKPKVEANHGGRYSAEVYDTIGRLMGMKASDRDAVLDIVKGLAK